MKLTALPLARPLLASCAFLLLATQALATWSIVVIDWRTREVCIASATCLSNFNLETFLPVVATGRGVGAAQSFIDTTGANRLRIYNGFMQSWSPQQILDFLAANDGGHQGRQYGIVSFDGPPVTFTGSNAGLARFGVVGEVDDLTYAIQGNVLAGDDVVLMTEAALVGATGDLSQRVMAAMEIARQWGGDGRCSCLTGAPPSCGSPPPSFTHTAYTGFMILARLGDVDGTCPQNGCANGDYYLNINVIGNQSVPDPVLTMQQEYDAWRLSKQGVPDHILSEVVASAERMVADGLSEIDVTVRLIDLEGVSLTQGGQTLQVTSTLPGAPVAVPGPVTDNGDGTHSFALTATNSPGTARYRIVVQDGLESIQLHPELVVRVDPLAELHAGYSAVSASTGAIVPFVLSRDPMEAGRPYQLLGTASGTTPGSLFRGITLPLNRDRLLAFTWLFPGPPLLPGSAGQLDASGRAEMQFLLTPSLLATFVGGRMDFSVVMFGTPHEATNAVGFDVLP